MSTVPDYDPSYEMKRNDLKFDVINKLSPKVEYCNDLKVRGLTDKIKDEKIRDRAKVLRYNLCNSKRQSALALYIGLGLFATGIIIVIAFGFNESAPLATTRTWLTVGFILVAIGVILIISQWLANKRYSENLCQILYYKEPVHPCKGELPDLEPIAQKVTKPKLR